MILQEPSVMFTEEYQVDSIKEYFPVFDKYRKQFFVGEMIWNFADFATIQGKLLDMFSYLSQLLTCILAIARF